MSKRKDAIALFDLISKGKTEHAPGMSVPGWFTKRPAPAEGPEGAEGTEGAPAPPASGPPPIPQSPVFSAETPAEPMFSTAPNQIRITLNYATCAIAGLGIVLLLGIFFWLGRLSARPSAPVAAGPEATPAPNVSGAAGGTSDPNVTAFLPVARASGKYYLIIDRMTGKTEDDRADAVAIYQYCQKSGQPCMALMYGTQSYAVLSLKPFDSASSREALDFAKSIEDLGKKYRPLPPRKKYNFSQQRAGRLDPSFYKEP
jgi:hypothetical protein